jgi:hypothetical protein
MGPWKLLGNPQDRTKKAPLGERDRLFLANLEHDEGEMTNVAEQHHDMVGRLMAHRESVLSSIEAR